MKEPVKNFLNFLFRIVLSAALLAYLYFKVDVEKTSRVLRSADLKYIVLAFLVFNFINIFLFIRWTVFIKALGLQAPLASLVRYYLIGLFGNLFLPSAIGGDVIKILGLCQYTAQKAKVVASVLLDRLSGFAGMVVVAVLAFTLGYKLINDPTLAFSILAMAVVSSLLATVLFHEGLYSWCSNVFQKFPRIKNGLMQVHYDVALLKDRRDAIYQAIGLSCLSQTTLVFVFFLLAKALHQDVALLCFFVFVPLICVASSLPSIGGLGVREAGAAYLLAKVGVASGVAVSLSLMTFVFMVAVGIVGGLIFLVTKSHGAPSGNLTTAHDQLRP
jgi:uncharacterized protein (TIRG00374 family)